MKPMQQEQQPQPGFEMDSTNTQIAPGIPVAQQNVDDIVYIKCYYKGCPRKAEHICHYEPFCCDVGCGKSICDKHAHGGYIRTKRSSGKAGSLYTKASMICDDCKPKARMVEKLECCFCLCFWPVCLFILWFVGTSDSPAPGMAPGKSLS